MSRGGKRPGAGRPDAGTPASGTRSIRLPVSLWQALGGLAVRRRTTVNAVVREVCEAITIGDANEGP